jgi:hypothetical protein
LGGNLLLTARHTAFSISATTPFPYILATILHFFHSRSSLEGRKKRCRSISLEPSALAGERKGETLPINVSYYCTGILAASFEAGKVERCVLAGRAGAWTRILFNLISE